MIRSKKPEDTSVLAALWEASARKTHHFVAEKDFPVYRIQVEKGLQVLEVYVVESSSGDPAGFIALDGFMIEMLFIDPAHFGKGLGTELVRHANRLRGALCVDVNEQNPDAAKFYGKNGFESFARSETDSRGADYPLLHMRQ